MEAIGQFLGALGFGAALALVGVMLTVRESRQRRYDERMDKRYTDLEADNKELDEENDKLRIDNTRLRVLCTSYGIDPDSPARIV